MTYSLRRTLAVRFAITMAAGLGVVAGAVYVNSGRTDLLMALTAVAVLGAGATFVGAWHLVTSATRPVAEITDQATRIEAGTLGQRIAAHAEAEEFRGLVAVLNRMLERLDRSFRGQRRLTADVSHELRTPLTALRGEIEVALRMERSPENYRRVLHSALEEIDRLTALTEDLLLITRVEGHALEAHRVPIDFNALVREAATAFEAGLEGKRVTLALELADDLGDVSVDSGLMRRLVRPLLENAAKFTPEGDRMTVVTSRDARGVRLAIIDSGPGLAPDDLPHIFEPFYRADQARTSGTGLGLGLSLAAAIARLHGATLTAENRPPPAGGARFELAIPAEGPLGAEALVSAIHQS